jgi:hypothetical protein
MLARLVFFVSGVMREKLPFSMKVDHYHYSQYWWVVNGEWTIGIGNWGFDIRNSGLAQSNKMKQVPWCALDLT